MLQGTGYVSYSGSIITNTDSEYVATHTHHTFRRQNAQTSLNPSNQRAGLAVHRELLYLIAIGPM